MNKIIWKKWQDPFRKLFNEGAYESDKIESLTEEEQDAVDSFSALTELPVSRSKKRKANEEFGEMLVSDAGVIPIFEHAIPSKLYNFWMGHTNFKLCESHLRKIVDVDGVEAIKVYSPYRFRIAIAMAFDPRTVRDSIVLALNKETAKAIKKNKWTESNDVGMRAMLQNYPYCANLIFSDGTHEFVCGDSIEEVQMQISMYSNVKKIVRSWDGSEANSK